MSKIGYGIHEIKSLMYGLPILLSILFFPFMKSRRQGKRGI